MKKNMIVWTLIMILLISTLVILFLPGKKESFDIKDRCGPIMNLIHHTIADETSCKTHCRSQCNTKDLEFDKIKFTLNARGCNECICTCKDSFL